MKLTFRLLLLSGVLATASFADITGTVYQNVPNPGNAGDVANMAANLPQATFTTAAINYNSSVTGYTPALFLNNPTFTNPQNGFNPNASFNNTEVVLNGSIFLNSGINSFVVGHDDGVVLSIAGIGTVVNNPGPTGFTNTPFNVTNPGAAGLFNFTLDYAECCGAPAVLLFQVNGSTVGGSVPEPGSVVLVGTFLVGFGFAARRKIGKSS